MNQNLVASQLEDSLDSSGQECESPAGNEARHRSGVASKGDLSIVSSSQIKSLDASVASAWTDSLSKRLFDCACVLLLSPLLAPILILVALAVRLTSHGPILFIQGRVGRNGAIFPILKFRTMAHVPVGSHHAVTTASNQRFTPVGLFLRRWKLDETPQLLNVLMGHMSLVGPRPKLPEHNQEHAFVCCRPGITGAATIAFAREEAGLAHVPANKLKAYYHMVVLPAKYRLDVEYMAQATFSSDFKLLVKSFFRKWDDSIWDTLPHYEDAVGANSISLKKCAQPSIMPSIRANPPGAMFRV